MKILLSLMVLFTLCSCATGPTQAKFKAKLESRIGTNINDLIVKIGPPARVFPMTNGLTDYHYSKSRKPSSESTYNPLTKTIDTEVTAYHCEVDYFVDAQSIIKSYRYSGNTCRSK